MTDDLSAQIYAATPRGQRSARARAVANNGMLYPHLVRAICAWAEMPPGPGRDRRAARLAREIERAEKR